MKPVGNTVRKTYSHPKPYIKRRVPTKSERRMLRRQKAVIGVLASFGSVFVIFLIAITLLLRGEDEYMAEKIVQLQEELHDMQKENMARENQINTSVDLSEIIKIATEQYGMQRPEESQIVYYHSQDREYISQVSKIPEVQE